MPPYRLFATISSVILASSITAHVSAADPIGSVVEFSDAADVEITKTPGKSRRPVKFATLYEGETISLKKDNTSLMVLFFQTQCFQKITGGSATLKMDGFLGKTKITKGQCLDRNGPQDVPASIGKLAAVGAVIARSSDGENTDRWDAIQPIPDSTILKPTTLTLQWPDAEGTTSYRVELRTTKGKRLWGGNTDTNSIANINPRIRNNFQYKWLVFADNHSDPLYEGQFSVASQSVSDEAETWMRIVGDTEDVPLHVLAGAYFQHAQMYGESLDIYERLVGLAPGQPKLHKGLAALYERAGRTAEASAALKRAEELTGSAGGKRVK